MYSYLIWYMKNERIAQKKKQKLTR